MSADVHAVAARRLALQAQRYTANRRALVERLVAAPQPLSITGIVEGRRDLAVSSVYRNLRVLTDAGVVARIVTSGDYACYELAEDLSSHHHHLICRTCHAVTDFEVPPDVEDALECLLDRVPGAAGFAVEDHRLDLIGVCSACR